MVSLTMVRAQSELVGKVEICNGPERPPEGLTPVLPVLDVSQRIVPFRTVFAPRRESRATGET